MSPLSVKARFLLWSALDILLIVILPHSFTKLTQYFVMHNHSAFSES